MIVAFILAFCLLFCCQLYQFNCTTFSLSDSFPNQLSHSLLSQFLTQFTAQLNPKPSPAWSSWHLWQVVGPLGVQTTGSVWCFGHWEIWCLFYMCPKKTCLVRQQWSISGVLIELELWKVTVKSLWKASVSLFTWMPLLDSTLVYMTTDCYHTARGKTAFQILITEDRQICLLQISGRICNFDLLTSLASWPAEKGSRSHLRVKSGSLGPYSGIGDRIHHCSVQPVSILDYPLWKIFASVSSQHFLWCSSLLFPVHALLCTSQRRWVPSSP